MSPQLQTGSLYCLKGGIIARYTPSAGWGPEQVTQPLTAQDARRVRLRYAQAAARYLWPEVDWMEEVAQELGIQLPNIPWLVRP